MGKVSEQRKAKMREYYRRNKQAMYDRMADWQYRKRLEFIEQLGGQCVNCGESNPIILDFDHIHNDGAAHRRELKRVTIVRHFSKHGVNTEQFQLLCKNCNWAKEYKRRKNAKRKQKAAQPDGDGCA